MSELVITYCISVLRDYIINNKYYEDTDPRLYNALFELKNYYKTNVIPQEHIDIFNELTPIITEYDFDKWCKEYDFDDNENQLSKFMKKYLFINDLDCHEINGRYNFINFELNTFKEIMKKILLQQINETK